MYARLPVSNVNTGAKSAAHQAALSATRKEERKNEKEGKNLYYINARSDIRAAVGHSLDLYGFIITFNC